jgi:hypothetical protein
MHHQKEFTLKRRERQTFGIEQIRLEQWHRMPSNFHTMVEIFFCFVLVIYQTNIVRRRKDQILTCPWFLTGGRQSLVR